MKKRTGLLSTLVFFLLGASFQTAHAQIWKKVKDEVKNRTERKVVTKAGDATDKAIDKTVDGATGKKAGDTPDNSNKETGKAKAATATTYKSYDFVPGDKIIFEPDLSTEPDAELPARFSIKSGNAEIQSFDGEKVLHLDAEGNASVAPLMNSENYLPEQFTVEFDMMYENDADYFKYVNDFRVEFRKAEDMNYKSYPLFRFLIENNSKVVLGGDNAGRQALPAELDKSVQTGNIWHHVAIYVRKNIGKAYIDQYRVAATNTLPVGAAKLNIMSDRYGIKIKNFRLAAGGDDKYNKIVTDGKFISHGILFDVNQSTIKPESMGALNEIVKLMQAHSDLKFEIDGHTDGDGKAEANMKLSQERADAVKAKLVDMGIDASRLSTKGFGATRPIDKNDSAEGKANNRRVEFVKL
jgi:outer membrane protein OmpA-like peptidoglycan-associated protein